MDKWRQTVNFGIALVALAAVGLLVVALWYNRFDEVLTKRPMNRSL